MLKTNEPALADIISIGLTCAVQGLMSKADVKAQILNSVSRLDNCNVATAEELPQSIFELLHKQLGLGFEVNGGKITGVTIDTGGKKYGEN